MRTSRSILFFTAVLLVLSTVPSRADLADIDHFLSEAPQKTISMDFKDAALTDVLKIFSQQSGLNFIAATNVSDKKINLYLDSVPVENALERILLANSLTYELDRSSNIFIVKELLQPATQLTTRIYSLKHATVQSSKLRSQIEDGGSSESGGTTAGSSSPGAGSGLLDAISAMLTPDGKIVEDPRTNSIIVSDLPSQFPLIEQTIARLDIRTPQILIEVEMLDISKNSADLLGAKFGDTVLQASGGARSTSFPFSMTRARGKVDADVAGSITGAYEFAENPGYTFGQLSFQGLQTVIQFLRTQNDTRSLARPRILTLNNETAQIEISTSETIGIIQTTGASEGLATTDVQPERADTGIFLKVTPQANLQTGEIVMAVEPRVIEAREGATFSGQSFRDPEERKTKSVLRMIDGDTVVIGGLLRTDVTDRRTRVPVLGSVPVLGAAFRHKDKASKERELIIFLTPHILKETLQSHPAGALATDPAPVVRERSMPSQKLDLVNQELQMFERGRR
jgi:type II secretory pathway component GspD/PulD (secretin)